VNTKLKRENYSSNVLNINTEIPGSSKSRAKPSPEAFSRDYSLLMAQYSGVQEVCTHVT
jgi:hypothetical protein